MTPNPVKGTKNMQGSQIKGTNAPYFHERNGKNSNATSNNKRFTIA